MSTETDNKAQSSTFPRTSLRARNKTLMFTPAAVVDFQGARDEELAPSLDLGEVLDESLASFDDTRPQSEIGTVSGGGIDRESVSCQERDGDDASVVLSNGYVEKGRAGQHEDSGVEFPTEQYNDHIEAISADIVAQAGGVNNLGDGSCAPYETDGTTDPINRGIRSIHGESSAVPSQPGVVGNGGDDIRSRMLSASGGRVLRSAPQDVEEGQSRDISMERCAYVDWKRKTRLIGFLVSYTADTMGAYSELREGRLLVTSQHSTTDNCFVISDESVSPMHAIMRIASDGSILILDQLSEHGTSIRRAHSGKLESLMGDKSSLTHGDVVIFGNSEYHVVVVGVSASSSGRQKD